jgi:hypothetical protein
MGTASRIPKKATSTGKRIAAPPKPVTAATVDAAKAAATRDKIFVSSNNRPPASEKKFARGYEFAVARMIFSAGPDPTLPQALYSVMVVLDFC